MLHLKLPAIPPLSDLLSEYLDGVSWKKSQAAAHKKWTGLTLLCMKLQMKIKFIY